MPKSTTSGSINTAYVRSGHSWLWLSVPSKGPYSGLRENTRTCSLQKESTKLWSLTSSWDPANWELCSKALGHPSHQEVKSCKIPNWSKLQQIRTVSGHELRPDLHTVLEPGSEILQDLNRAKLQPVRTVSTRSWAKTRFEYSLGTRKWNLARSQIEQVL